MLRRPHRQSGLAFPVFEAEPAARPFSTLPIGISERRYPCPVDRTSTPDRRVPAGRPGVTWGLGDFAWVYFAGIVSSAVLGTIGFAISGDQAGDTGVVTVALTFAGQFGGWIAALVVVSRLKGRGTLRADFGLVVHRRELWLIVVGVVLEVALAAMIYPIANLVQNERQSVVDELNSAQGAKLALLVVFAGLVAPICEEVLFRGLLLRALSRRLSAVGAVTVSALVFALAHPALDPELGTLAVVPALFALGAVCGALAVRRGNLSASILVHVGFNLLTTASALFGALNE